MSRIGIYILTISIGLHLNGQSMLKGRSLFEKGNKKEAKAELQQFQKGNKDYAEAQYYLGRIAFDEGKFDDAVKHLETAISINNQVAKYHNWLGNSIGMIVKDANMFKQSMLVPKMRDSWEMAAKLDSNHLEVRSSLIAFYLRAPAVVGGGIDKAKEMAKQNTRIHPPTGHRQMGNILMRENKVKEAEKEYLAMYQADESTKHMLCTFYIRAEWYDKAFALYETEAFENKDLLAGYHYGRVSAASGQKLEKGEKYLKHYLEYKPKDKEPTILSAKLLLAQIQEKLGKKKEAKLLYEEVLTSDQNSKEAKDGLARVAR